MVWKVPSTLYFRKNIFYCSTVSPFISIYFMLLQFVVTFRVMRLIQPRNSRIYFYNDMPVWLKKFQYQVNWNTRGTGTQIWWVREHITSEIFCATIVDHFCCCKSFTRFQKVTKDYSLTIPNNCCHKSHVYRKGLSFFLV